MTTAPAFDRWLDQFFDTFYRQRPVDATFAGIHIHDHRLPDCSPEGLASAAADLARLRAELTALPEEPLTEAQQHDRMLADGALEIGGWELESAHFQRGNPSYYTGEAVFSIMALFHRDAEPVNERAAAAIDRMRAIPEFLAQGRAAVSSAPRLWTERAIREADAAIAYFGRGIALLANESGIATADFAAAAAVATAAFSEHRQWLETVLLAAPSDHYAAGREALELLLRRAHLLAPEQNAVWVDQFARSALTEAQAELVNRATKREPERSWQAQLGDLANDHPTVDEYYAVYGRVWQEAKNAAIAADLVTWPDYPIDYVPFPASDRDAAAGLYYLFYRCPAPFGRSEIHRYRVTPVDASLPADEQERRLRATNNAVIKLNHVVHHGGLGHHVQNWNAFRAESRIGRMAGVDGASRIALLCAGTLVEGWACYATDLAEEIGYLTPLEALSEQQSRVRMAARAVADIGIHTGAMTLADATAFYVREAGMSAAAAEGEAVKNAMFPGAALMYLIGTTGIHDLRATMQQREGAAFSLRSFHDRVLAYGAIPVALIARSMTR